MGGIAFYSRDAISSIYKKLPAVLTMELPKSMWIKNPDCKIVVETCFVRERIEEEDEEHERNRILKCSRDFWRERIQ